MSFFSTGFWAYAGERAIKTFAQASAAVIGTGAMGILELDLLKVVSIGATAALLSILTSVANHKGE